MSRANRLRVRLCFALLASSGATGCIHNHYYGTPMPGCPPIGQTVTTQLGAACDVPSGQVVVTGPSSPKTISSEVAPQPTQGATLTTSPAPRIVFSQPVSGPPSIGQSTSRFKWRKPDPETLPIMKAEGALDDPITRQ